MNQSPSPRPTDDALCDCAIFGPELDGTVAPDAEHTEFEQLAATYYLAGSQLEPEALPGSVRTKLLATFPADAAARAATRPTPSQTDPAPPTVRASQSGLGGVLPWLVAIAASLFIGFLLGRPADRLADGVDLAATLADLETSADVIQAPWSATDDPAAAEAEGRVVWSGDLQQGYMVFRGLAANDPANEQYQLWVFDAERDARYPVDGGVFDIPSGVAEVIVPINVRVPVAAPTLFAITIEPPGGVVVSDRSRLPLAATVAEAG